ncbi:MAG: hypothetical protein ACC651_15935, partial [Candidatus Scalindua sp.]
MHQNPGYYYDAERGNENDLNLSCFSLCSSWLCVRSFFFAFFAALREIIFSIPTTPSWFSVPGVCRLERLIDYRPER